MSWRRIVKPFALPERIASDRLVLRPFQYGDADDLFSYANDEEWSRFISPPYPYTREYAESFVRNKITGHKANKAFWCLEFQGRMIGDIDMTVDTANLSAEIAYSLARRHWNQGLMSEALQAVFAAIFDPEPLLNRLFVRIDTRNLASTRVAEKLGLRLEGTLRQSRFHKGHFVDDAIYAILREERKTTRSDG